VLKFRGQVNRCVNVLRRRPPRPQVHGVGRVLRLRR
jgi:hypothetical protein